MRKTPSYLKGLAETRARAAGDVQRYQHLYEDIGQKLAVAKAELDACDRLIRKYDGRLDPNLIPTIRAWQGRYGKRGQLKEYLKGYLQERASNEVSTSELCCAAQMEFGLDFPTWKEKKKWQTNSVAGALKKLVAEGLVERIHDYSDGPTGEVGHWRWKTDSAPSLDHLRAQAAAAGVAILHVDDSHA